jgi:hypothetical protein
MLQIYPSAGALVFLFLVSADIVMKILCMNFFGVMVGMELEKGNKVPFAIIGWKLEGEPKRATGRHRPSFAR